MKYLHKFNFTEDFYKHVYTFNGGGRMVPNIPNVMLDASCDDVYYSTAIETLQIVPSDYVRLEYIKNAESGYPSIETSAIDLSKFSVRIEFSENEPENGFLLWSQWVQLYRAYYYSSGSGALQSFVACYVKNSAGSSNIVSKTLYFIQKNKSYPSRKRITMGIKSDPGIVNGQLSETNYRWHIKVEDLDSNSTVLDYETAIDSEFLNRDFSSHKFVVFSKQTSDGRNPYRGNLYSLDFPINERSLQQASENTPVYHYYPAQNINTGTVGLIERKVTSSPLYVTNSVVEYTFKQSTTSGTYEAGPIYKPELEPGQSSDMIHK